MSRTATPRRRWYQYSLRALLVTMTLCALVCAWAAVRLQQARKQREAVEVLKRRGAWVHYDYERNASPYSRPEWIRRLLGIDLTCWVVDVSLHGESCDEDLACLQELPGLEDLHITSGTITVQGMARLEGVKKLKRLVLFWTPIGDDGWAGIGKLTTLESLDLHRTGGTDAGLVHLGRLRDLQSLSLIGESIGDAGVEHLRQLDHLRTLDLDGTRITNGALAHLASMVHLETLVLSRTAITDAGLEPLAKLPRLARLNLSETKVQGEGLCHLRELTGLVELNLAGTPLTDAGVEHLKAMGRLQDLNVSGTEISEDGEDAILQALPDCSVYAPLRIAMPKPPPATRDRLRDLDFNPLERPAPAWIPEPRGVAGTDAANEDEMKAYTERLPVEHIAFEMVPIRGGVFRMGSPATERGRKPDEGPQLDVAIEPFWMGKCEVTWQEFEAWVLTSDAVQRAIPSAAEEPYSRVADAISRPTDVRFVHGFGMGKAGRPAICMSQFGAQVYCKWLCAKTGRYYRLPTEAEWEYACRAGTTTAYSFGDDAAKLGEYAWFEDNTPTRYQRVGAKKPNAWGLHDMHGNVAEWVLDQYAADAYKAAPSIRRNNPYAVPTSLYPRVVRGGSWQDDAASLRSAARRGSHKDWNMQDPQIPQNIWWLTDGQFVGFRVLRPLRVPSAEAAKKYEPDPAILKGSIQGQSRPL